METNTKKRILTSEQLDRINQNREAALRRRSTKLSTDEASGWINTRKVQATHDENAKMNSVLFDLPVKPYSPPEFSQKPIEKIEKDKNTVLKPSSEQMKVLKSVAMLESVFLTGSAGTGKSFILHFAIRQLRSLYGSDGVYVTASTGLAACGIGGTTIHSFAGIGLGNGEKEELLDKVSSRREVRQRWQKASALVIDEISMVDADLFEKLEFIARKLRKNERPFGGIQLIVSGDFFQLPPVSKNSEVKKFAFEAPCWSKCFHLQIELTQVFRQSEQEFVKLLNEIRMGSCSMSSKEKLQGCRFNGSFQDGIVQTRLYPHKVHAIRS